MAVEKDKTSKEVEQPVVEEAKPQEPTTPEGIPQYTQIKYNCSPRGYAEITIGNVIYSVTPDDRFIYFGDIPNMKDQCIVSFMRNGVMLVGLDKTKIIVVKEDDAKT